MANQTRQLRRLLEGEGIHVTVVQTNAPYRPAWIESVRGARALFRLFPYAWRLFVESGRADVVHVMANSGWAWHLFAVPAIRIAGLRRALVVVNYRGGLAREFLSSHAASVKRAVSIAGALAVPSRFLQEIFAAHGMPSVIVPNVVDTEVFRPADSPLERPSDEPHIVVARNLEALYGNDVAIKALAIVRQRHARARLSIAGSGPELDSLRHLAAGTGLEHAVHFTGRLEVQEMVALYQDADVVLNPSRADNTPNSVLEALACGVPVVSTDVGGMSYLVQHEQTAWLVPPESPERMADGIVRLLADRDLRRNLVRNGLLLAAKCSWPAVREKWLALYRPGLLAAD
jgi:glycosyltransferase involved in cell wall biosynthesis